MKIVVCNLLVKYLVGTPGYKLSQHHRSEQRRPHRKWELKREKDQSAVFFYGWEMSFRGRSQKVHLKLHPRPLSVKKPHEQMKRKRSNFPQSTVSVTADDGYP